MAAMKAATCGSTFAHTHRDSGIRCSSSQKSAGPAGRTGLREARAAPSRRPAGNKDIVRGGDWCKANPLRWTDRKVCGRNMYGPTLQAAYEQWKQSGRAAEVDE
jgi:hypothetical protein